MAWWAGLVVLLSLIEVVIWLAKEAAKFSKPAAWIQVRYPLWLMFATSLNAGIIVLN
ncbi:tryptophan-rich sensory protein [Jonesiaceae bacterium BS-20]|uniref:Tryptophan-rich sensory protein n=1 Tax=Jonesiaceae bacterium BS-20 TaxID=3120821 RepID=A0AAU7DSR6_9MICO